VPEVVGATMVMLPTGDSCPGGWTEEATLYSGVDPGCATCTCSPSAGQCNQATITRYMNSDCSSPKDQYTDIPDNTCVDVEETQDPNQAHS
jgi:hypothetical protein